MHSTILVVIRDLEAGGTEHHRDRYALMASGCVGTVGEALSPSVA